MVCIIVITSYLGVFNFGCAISQGFEMKVRPARLFFAIFWAILGHRAYGPKKNNEEIDFSIKSIGPMAQNCQKKWRKISEHPLSGLSSYPDTCKSM